MHLLDPRPRGKVVAVDLATAAKVPDFERMRRHACLFAGHTLCFELNLTYHTFSLFNLNPKTLRIALGIQEISSTRDSAKQ